MATYYSADSTTVEELYTILGNLIAEGKGQLAVVTDDYGDFDICIVQLEDDKVRLL